MNKHEGREIVIQFDREILMDDVSGLKSPESQVVPIDVIGSLVSSTETGSSYSIQNIRNREGHWRTNNILNQFFILDTEQTGMFLKGFTFYSGSNRPKDFIVEGSNDSEQWVQIQQSTIANDNTVQTFDWETPTEFRYYKWSFLSAYTSTYIRIDHLQLLLFRSKDRAFKIKGKELNRVGGELVDKNYEVMSVRPYYKNITTFLPIDQNTVFETAPFEIPEEGLSYWLDASSMPSGSQDELGKYIPYSVSETANKAKSGNFTQSDTIKQPTYIHEGINGKPSFKFNKQGFKFDSTHLNQTENIHIFTVVERSSAGETYGTVAQAIWPNNNRMFEMRCESSNYLGMDFYNTSTTSRQTKYMSIDSNYRNKPIIFQGLAAIKDREIIVELADIQKTSGSSLGTGIPSSELLKEGSIGYNSGNGDRNFIGMIAEVLIYNRRLNPQEIQQVNSYLSNKYDISLKNGIPSRPTQVTFPLVSNKFTPETVTLKSIGEDTAKLEMSQIEGQIQIIGTFSTPPKSEGVKINQKSHEIEKDSLLIKTLPHSKFRNVRTPLFIEYLSSLGGYMGLGDPVEDFTVSTIATGLEKIDSPNTLEHIDLSLESNIGFFKPDKTDLSFQENISLGLASTLKLTLSKEIIT